MRIIKTSSESFGKNSAELIANKINKLLLNKDYVTLGVVGGQSIRKVLYEMRDINVPWKKVHIFMIDERISQNPKDSNFLVLREELIDYLLDRNLISKENIHPFFYSMEKLNDSIKKYERELNKYGGKFDIVLVSSGEDGHIASLFPRSESLNDRSNFLLIENAPKPPKMRITASRFLISLSSIGIILFRGENKINAYLNFLKDDCSFFDFPSAILKSIRDLHLITDIRQT